MVHLDWEQRLVIQYEGLTDLISEKRYLSTSYIIIALEFGWTIDIMDESPL